MGGRVVVSTARVVAGDSVASTFVEVVVTARVETRAAVVVARVSGSVAGWARPRRQEHDVRQPVRQSLCQMM